MDPNTTLAEMVLHLCAGDSQAAREKLGFLRDWINGGGFPPDLRTTLAELHKSL